MTSQKIGFRDVRIAVKYFLVRGQPATFYRINRHDFNRKKGRVVTRDDMCDELGFYTVGEAKDLLTSVFEGKVELHGRFQAVKSVGVKLLFLLAHLNCRPRV